MPQALAFVLPGVFAAGGSVALFTAAGTLTVAGTLVSIGGSLILSALTAPKVPDLPQFEPEAIKVNAAGETSPRIRHYGRVRVGYARVFARAQNGTLYQVIVHGHGQFAEIERYLIDKTPVTLGVSGDVVEALYQQAGTPLVRIESRLGTAPQAVLQTIQDAFPDWDDDHRLDGLACSAIRATLPPLERYNDVYPNGDPKLEVEAKTQVVTDPRTGATGFSENLALCALHYEQSPDGGGLPGLVDVNSYAAAADHCDEQVALATGGTEARYRFAGSYALSEEPAAVRQRFLGACAGQNYLTPQGKLGLRVGVPYEPRYTLTAADMLSLNVDFGPDAVSGYNVNAFEYVEPALQFARVSGDPWRDEARIALQGEIKATPFISAPSHRQCRAVAKIQTMLDNPRITMRARAKPRAQVALFEPFIRVSAPEYGVDGVFRVNLAQAEPGTMAVQFELSGVDQTAYTQSVADQGTPPASIAGAPAEGGGIPAVTGFNAAPLSVGGGDGIGAAWNASPSVSYAPRLEYRETGSSLSWQRVTLDPTATAAEIGGLPGASYDLRIAWEAPSGGIGPYSTETGVAPSTGSGAPGAPTGLAVTKDGAGDYVVAWTTTSTTTIWKTEVYADGVLAASVVGEPSTAQSIALSQAGLTDTTDFTAQTVSVAGATSTVAGPVSIT